MALTKARQVERSAAITPSAPAIEATEGAGRICIGVVVTYLLVIAISSGILRLPGVVPHGNETTWDRAIFSSINAATLTGFQQTMGVREMSAAGPGGPAVLFGLTILGSWVSMFVGGVAGVRVLRLNYAPGRIALSAITAQAVALVVGAAILIGPDNSLFQSLFQAASAFGNSGLWIGNFPSATAPSSYAALLPLSILGGLGLPVLMELTNALFGHSNLSEHSRLVLKLSAMIFLLAFAGLMVAQFPIAIGGGWPAWRSTIASCAVTSVNSRTAGMPFESPAAFTAAGQWLIMALMLIGAAPAGTAGGLKLTTLWQLAAGTRDALAERRLQRASGIAGTWVLIYVCILFSGVLLLVSFQSQLPGERLLFLAISALSDCGLSHDPVSITGPALLVLSWLMLCGRFAPLAILWWMARTSPGSGVLVG
jgi:Trk-type K+ transport system membrane component